MRHKYVEEKYPKWFINGDLICAFNTKREFDVSIRTRMSESELVNLVEEHNMTVEKLCEIACAWADSDHKAFTDFWYDKV